MSVSGAVSGAAGAWAVVSTAVSAEASPSGSALNLFRRKRKTPIAAASSATARIAAAGLFFFPVKAGTLSGPSDASKPAGEEYEGAGAGGGVGTGEGAGEGEGAGASSESFAPQNSQNTLSSGNFLPHCGQNILTPPFPIGPEE
jgi:hypothetical protein